MSDRSLNLNQSLDDVHPSLLEIIDYRKSGLSLNHIVGCPLDCAYCVRHFFNVFDLKEPTILCSDEDATRKLVENRWFKAHHTPIQLFNRATDPFLPSVRPHTHKVLELLDARGLTNLLLIITRYRVTQEDMLRLEALKHLRITLLVTYSGIPDGPIEPFPHTVTLAAIDTIAEHKKRTKLVLYWRPIVPGWNDSDATLSSVLTVAASADAIAFTGLFFRSQQRQHFIEEGIPIPYASDHRRKILSHSTEERILRLHKDSNCRVPLFRKTSCAVSYAHGVSDYNGHYGVPELCEICPMSQRAKCLENHQQPSFSEFSDLLSQHQYKTPFEITPGHIWTTGLGDEKRYHLQHILAFQVWDKTQPHLPQQHGRAPLGY